MISRFFIDRPIFASVISILITLVGGISLFSLPLAQYPPITPPTIQVDCNYPGAGAETVMQTIAAPIEQQVNGVEDMLYMTSMSTSDGSYSLTVTFKTGVNLNLAQVLVQNRVSLAMPQLPEVVRQTGVTTRKRSPDILLTVSLNSPEGDFSQLELSNYAVVHLRDELARLPGVSEVRIFGQRDHSMRIWLDPDKLAARELTVAEVIAAIREQNTQVALGQIGQPPTANGPLKQIPLSIKGRLVEPEDFGKIVIRATKDGRMLRLRDVARAEIGARMEDTSNRFDLMPTVGLAVFQQPDANALATADIVKAKMRELAIHFPRGMAYDTGYDTTPFIRESIFEVFKSLRDAIILVALVVLVFLQGWRPAIIPLVAVPVAIIGTFAAMLAVGFSLNNLTLFGLVLAIGIVVDDAIVVVEAVEQYIERGFGPREAAIRAMDEVSGPIIAVGLVLSAVFIPCAFVSGIVGMFFRQFALTIAISTILSTINSLTLSPALAALLLSSRETQRDWFSRIVDFCLGWLFRLFNRGVQKSIDGYLVVTAKMLRVPSLVLVVYVGLLLLTIWGYRQLPTGFIPSQDKGYLVGSVQLPDATAIDRTLEVTKKIEAVALNTPGVKHVNSIGGNSFQLGARASNFGSMFVILDTFDERRSPELNSNKILGELKKRIGKEVPEATVSIFPPPAVSGLGRSGGFKLMIEDRGDVGMHVLEEQTQNVVAVGNTEPDLTGLMSVYSANSPQLYIDVDRDACLSQGVTLQDVFGTLQACLGSRYVNDFNEFGRTWQVVVQADAQFRDQVDDFRRLKVRNRSGQMVPLATLAQVRPDSGPLVLTRYNMYPAAAINGNVADGVSTGSGIAELEAICSRELAPAMSFEWTELTYLERISGNTGLLVFAFSVVFVFLLLAALYESWSLPLAVILVVPMCVSCSLAGIAIAKMDINIFTQIGFVVLIGLACKNAILIVEFAKLRRDEGEERHFAILAACRQRLRPILMTSFAFILGVLPLVAASGAGWEMRRALGTAVFSGMLGVTMFGIFLTPVFFLVVDWLSHNSLFSAGIVPRLGRISLDLLRLGPVVRLSAATWKRVDALFVRRDKPTSPPAASKKAECVVDEKGLNSQQTHEATNDAAGDVPLPLEEESTETPAEITSSTKQ